MARSSDKPKGDKKPKVGKKLTPAGQKKLDEALTLLKTLYADVAAVWGQMTADQREAYKAHSPILAAVLEWARMFEEVG